MIYEFTVLTMTLSSHSTWTHFERSTADVRRTLLSLSKGRSDAFLFPKRRLRWFERLISNDGSLLTIIHRHVEFRWNLGFWVTASGFLVGAAVNCGIFVGALTVALSHLAYPCRVGISMLPMRQQRPRKYWTRSDDCHTFLP